MAKDKNESGATAPIEKSVKDWALEQKRDLAQLAGVLQIVKVHETTSVTETVFNEMWDQAMSEWK